MSSLALPAFARPAAATEEAAEATFLALTNAERTSRGLGALVVADDLVGVARGQAAEMAAANRLYHNPDLEQEVRSWQLIGENVGRGPSAERIHQAFMASSTHRAEILQTRFTEIGVGAVSVAGVLWVSEVFRQRDGAATASPAAVPVPVAARQALPAAPQAAAPAPAPVPAPATRRTRAATAVPRPAPSSEAAPATIPPPPPDPVADALAAALDAAAGSRPDGVVDARATRMSLTGAASAPPSLPRLPVSFAGSLLLAVVAAQVRTVPRLRAAA